jgi:hypothetical protein
VSLQNTNKSFPDRVNYLFAQAISAIGNAQPEPAGFSL